jgi:hypothetical protein
MMLRLRIVLFLGCLLLSYGTLTAQDVAVRARVDSTEYAVGDPISVHLDATHPKGTTFKLAVADSLDSFVVLDRGAFTPTSETVSGATLTVAKYDSGSAALPPLEILYTIPGDTALHRVLTNPLLLTVRTLTVDTSQAFKDLKPPISIPLSLAEIATYLGIVLLICAFAYLGYRYWKKRSRKEEGVVYVPPARPAHVIALEELAALKEKRLWQQGQIKQYYSEVSEITRRFIENRFRLMALEQTTDEIMDGMKRIRIKPAICGKVETLLQLSDLVKFARFQPGIAEHDAILSMAYDVVQAALPADPAPAQQIVTGEAERVGS